MKEFNSKTSVLLPTFNNESIVRECLETVKWADEILVVDSFSTDGTLDICREYGARIVQHEYVNSAKQKNWAIPQCAHEWVLQIDSDERLEPELGAEIREALAQVPNDVQAFKIPRKNRVLGVWVKEARLYPDYQIRLFRRDVARFEEKEVHAHIEVPGTINFLHHNIIHRGMPNIKKQLANLDRYTGYQAAELNKRGIKFHWYQLLFRPLAILVYFYIWKRGFMAGHRGLVVAAYDATYDFWTRAKLWELEQHEGHTH